MQYKPVTYNEETGWSWPPQPLSGHLYGDVLAQFEDVLWTLYHEGGEINAEDQGSNATRILAQKMHRPQSDDRRMSQVRERCKQLEQMGLIVRIKPSKDAKRVRFIGLTWDGERKPPGTDPHAVQGLKNVEKILGPPPQQQFPTASEVAEALLRRVMDETGEIDQLRAAIDDYKKLVDVKDGLIKSKTAALIEAEETIKRLNHNLEAAVSAAKDLSNKAGVTLSQQLEQDYRQMMERRER